MQRLQPVTQRCVGLWVQVAVAVQREADRGMPRAHGDLLGRRAGGDPQRTAVWRRSWIRRPGRPAALVAGTQKRARKLRTRSGPPPGAVQTRRPGGATAAT